ncbi:MAG TPA: ABC transporter permease [Steroidobacteraceae bacterium]|nr:ABC transporter permease [Steroidobacteraceae bacterium]
MSRQRLSWMRLRGILGKEFIQLRRDRMTFGMIVMLPIMQLLLFGFAINSDPKYLPTAVLSEDSGPFVRSLVSALQVSEYFRVIAEVHSPDEAHALLERGDVQFVINVPGQFERKLARADPAQLLVEVDATDPVASSNALAALQPLIEQAMRRDLPEFARRDLAVVKPVDLRIHRLYNAAGISAYNTVPGLLGVILTMTMVMMTALAMTRERERGTFETLLATPALPTEVMIGKIVPYVVIGLVQVTVMLLAALLIFHVPFIGSVALIYAMVLAFSFANLILGITVSSLARNQLQAVQAAIFIFLPSILLSGFMFPFRGMPTWAQWIGNALPLTHFVVIVRGVMLKGVGLAEVWQHLAAIGAFTLAVLGIGLRFYKRTLD